MPIRYGITTAQYISVYISLVHCSTMSVCYHLSRLNVLDFSLKEILELHSILKFIGWYFYAVRFSYSAILSVYMSLSTVG